VRLINRHRSRVSNTLLPIRRTCFFTRFAARRLEGETLRDSNLGCPQANSTKTRGGPGTKDEKSKTPQQSILRSKRSQLIGSMVGFRSTGTLSQPRLTTDDDNRAASAAVAEQRASPSLGSRLGEAGRTKNFQPRETMTGSRRSAKFISVSSPAILVKRKSLRRKAVLEKAPEQQTTRRVGPIFCQVILGLNEFAYLEMSAISQHAA
jgi:hypothetical protein